MAFKNLDFLNANSLRNYPVKEGLTKISTDGTFTLPDDFITDLILSASSDITKRFYISKIVNLPTFVTVEIKDSADVVVGLFTVNVSSHTSYKDYYMTPGTSYPGANGRLNVGSISTMIAYPTGTFYFTLSTTELEARTSVPSLNAVNRLILKDANGNSVAYTGDVTITLRKNLRVTDVDGAALIDAGDGLGLNANCSDTTLYIKTINGQEPDDDKNFTIIPADCAAITPLSGANASGILLSDTCCKPCMGCDEISTLTERAMELESDLLKIRDSFNSIQETIAQLSSYMNFSCEC